MGDVYYEIIEQRKTDPLASWLFFSYLIAFSMKIAKGAELLELIGPNSSNQYFSLSP